MSTVADINSTTARPDPGGEWYPEGDLPEQGFGSRTTLLPAIYNFKLPENLSQLWHEVEIKDPRPFLPSGQVNPTRDQPVKRWQLKLDRNAPMVIESGPFAGEPMTATFTTNPRARGGKRDDPKTAWISDVTYLLDTALQGNVPPQSRIRPKDAAGVMAEINKYAGKVIRLETGLTAQCRPDRERYIRVTVDEGGVPQTTDMKDPAGIKGCGKRFYTQAFKNPDAGQPDGASGKLVPNYDTEIACDCGNNPTPAQVEAGAQPGQLVVLRGFEQVERFLPPIGAPGK